MNSHLHQRIEDLLDDPKLTTWEIDFLEDIQSRVKMGVELTLRQEEKLEEIEDRS